MQKNYFTGAETIGAPLGNVLVRSVQFDVTNANVSDRVIICIQNDNYSRQFMTNSPILAEYTYITGGKVVRKKHTIIAAGSLILPAITIDEVTCLASMCLVKNSLEPWFIYSRILAKKNRERENRIFLLESQLKSESWSLIWI